MTKGHCPIKQRDQNSAKDPDKIAKKRSERRERSHLLKEKIIKLIEGGLQLSEYQARKVHKRIYISFKGQFNSEWIYEIINFPKNDPKNLKDFCPESFFST